MREIGTYSPVTTLLTYLKLKVMVISNQYSRITTLYGEGHTHTRWTRSGGETRRQRRWQYTRERLPLKGSLANP